MNYSDEYNRWRIQPHLDPNIANELIAIANDDKGIAERFYTRLEFGTAGLRGILGAGTNRMNIYVVRQATQGLADYICGIPGAAERGVAIAHDSRINSDLFAREAACVLAANGIHVYLFSSLRAVPQLSFTVVHKKAYAGIVITASHNPPEYNGYKVYNEFGGQLDPDAAAAVTRKIERVDMFEVHLADFDGAVCNGTIEIIGEEVDEVYYNSLKTLLVHPNLPASARKAITIVYTPLHGAGNVPVREILKRTGLGKVYVVPEQEYPDGNFPTVKAPNPEDKNAFTLAAALGKQKHADLLLATDPDSDRMGVGLLNKDGEYELLTGNKIAELLIYYLLSSMKERGCLPDNGLVVKSAVSTRMADVICADFGVTCEEVLTGFRFISEKIVECKESHEREFIFGFEESYGFLAGTYSRDKDAICASMLIAEACAYYKSQGKSLLDIMRELSERFGYYEEVTKSYTESGMDGMKLIADAMTHLREHPFDSICGAPVTIYEDYNTGTRIQDGVTSRISLPKSNMLRYIFDGGWVSVRPSGTEPKLKVYIGVNAPDEKTAQAMKERVPKEICAVIDGLLHK